MYSLYYITVIAALRHDHYTKWDLATCCPGLLRCRGGRGHDTVRATLINYFLPSFYGKGRNKLTI
jgi:hypothetical protein